MQHGNRNYLFCRNDLWATLEGQKQAAVTAVGALPRDQFLATSVDTLVEHLVAEHTIGQLVLHEDKMRMDNQETKIDVTGRFDYDMGDGGRHFTAGQQLTFHLPFSCEPHLWHLKPNISFSVMPAGDVNAQASVVTITLVNTSDTESNWYKRELDSRLSSIRQLIHAQNQMLAQYHSSLPTSIRAAIDQRRGQIEKMQGLTAAFDIPLIRKSGMPEFKPIEVTRKIPRPLPRAPTTGYKPEPAITDQLFEDILGIVRHAGASFEGAPQTYQPLGEEGLRDNVLSHLNVVFEGRATGETFRKYGKTDIRIEEDSRSAFVGECKLWGGERLLQEALMQLLGYLTWRDCKAALVIFNKDVAGFSGIQETIASVLPKQKGFLRAKETGRVGEWRFVFQSTEDLAREVTVHVFAFNLYVTPERASKKR
jgi:hypothetical protein